MSRGGARGTGKQAQTPTIVKPAVNRFGYGLIPTCSNLFHTQGDYAMFKNTNNDSNNGNDGFVWSGRATLVLGFVFAAALAAAKYGALLAAPLDWVR
jgi:hypothetical protein